VLVRGVVEALSGGQSIRIETGHHGLRPADVVPFESFVLGAGMLSVVAWHTSAQQPELATL
jgi:hypothetical protein